MSDASRRLVLGVGNPDRGDDGVGRLVARLLRGRVPMDVRVEEAAGDAAGVIEKLQGVDWAILVDAAVSGAPVGTVHRVDCIAGDALPSSGGTSSHGLGVAEAVALARALGCLPRWCVIYAVEGAYFRPGSDVSRQVADAAADVAARVAAEFACTSPAGAGEVEAPWRRG